MAIINGKETDIDCSGLVSKRKEEREKELLEMSSNEMVIPATCVNRNNMVQNEAERSEFGKLNTLGQLSSVGWTPGSGENNQGNSSQQATPFQRQSESRSAQEHQGNERATKKCCTIM
ncbi:hypothetical protein PsalMR5_04518 (plasmid) [Piscirickettsia salmonis]|uniref:hypothetical protein n=1 Tax=Piscirickettsia salmonis TaxID=1238 RepID=UPI0012BB0B00|nr:hypothetical protein [Piscirickettsia salmonis]QGP57003.1 hypothetical protein PsalSR1_04492 [Piscirickettsia salmonis]QGP61759.1 hypothetical protein PsalBI1_04401 [Piscirickettsia salmonis]QGP66593.1 hypothetical protein PsalMR5_04518 [Piscirickettsia salmonis]